jgi:hypothetical protein
MFPEVDAVITPMIAEHILDGLALFDTHSSLLRLRADASQLLTHIT